MEIEIELFDYIIYMMAKYKTIASAITMSMCGVVVSIFTRFNGITGFEVAGAIVMCACLFAMMVICHMIDPEVFLDDLVNEREGS